ncbi:hypothetical protein EDC01DRAFT_626134 [Geopyxis carbonaria]|nr:hypothetical protein EDC01DRAFT_626134 [Geopyxis carbonaria]
MSTSPSRPKISHPPSSPIYVHDDMNSAHAHQQYQSPPVGCAAIPTFWRSKRHGQLGGYVQETNAMPLCTFKSTLIDIDRTKTPPKPKSDIKAYRFHIKEYSEVLINDKSIFRNLYFGTSHSIARSFKAGLKTPALRLPLNVPFHECFGPDSQTQPESTGSDNAAYPDQARQHTPPTNTPWNRRSATAAPTGDDAEPTAADGATPRRPSTAEGGTAGPQAPESCASGRPLFAILGREDVWGTWVVCFCAVAVVWKTCGECAYMPGCGAGD